MKPEEFDNLPTFNSPEEFAEALDPLGELQYLKIINDPVYRKEKEAQGWKIDMKQSWDNKMTQVEIRNEKGELVYFKDYDTK